MSFSFTLVVSCAKDTVLKGSTTLDSNVVSYKSAYRSWSAILTGFSQSIYVIQKNIADFWEVLQSYANRMCEKWHIFVNLLMQNTYSIEEPIA